MSRLTKYYDLVRPGSPELARRGLQCILRGPEDVSESCDSQTRRRRESLEAYCLRHNVNTARQVLAIAGGRVIAACLWIPHPGRSALFYITNRNCRPESGDATGACIAAAAGDARVAGVVLAQAVADIEDFFSISAFHAGGFVDLANLYYMQRTRPLFEPRSALPTGITLTPYSPANHELFARTIVASYENTLDCPLLTGLRSIDDVIAGYQAAAVFDPSLWLLAMENRRPLGALLMAWHSQRETLEVVYLGVKAQVRRRGMGTALMKYVLYTMAKRNSRWCVLAVDKANTPALRLYRRAHYRVTGERRVLIGAVRGAAPRDA